MNTRIVSIGIIAIVASVLYIFFSSLDNSTPSGNTPQTTVNEETEAKAKPTPTQTTPYTASFAIYTNNTFRVFTQSMYHNTSDDVYITSSTPNTVTVENTGITWNDFFKTLPFSLTKDCLTTGTGQTFCTDDGESLKFYLNGSQNPDALSEEIQSDDELLVTFGPLNDLQVKEQLAILSGL